MVLDISWLLNTWRGGVVLLEDVEGHVFLSLCVCVRLTNIIHIHVTYVYTGGAL